MWKTFLTLSLLLGACDSEQSQPSGSTQQPGICSLHNDGVECFSLLVLRRTGPAEDKLVEQARCRSVGMAEPNRITHTGGMLDVHCESEDGSLVVDLHVRNLARNPSTPGVVNLASDSDWLRIRATDSTAGAFAEAVDGAVDLTFSTQNQEYFSFRGDLIPEAFFDCDAEEGQDCPQSPHYGKEVYLAEIQVALADLDIWVTSVLHLPDLPNACHGFNGHLEPCPQP